MKPVPPAAALALVLLAAGPAPAGPRQEVSPRADALDLLVLGGESPVRLELRVVADGKPVPALWDETFARLLAFFDRDGDGLLARPEAARLPSAFALRQVAWGQFTPFTGEAPPFEELDPDRDGKVGGDELADYYRRAGLGGVLVGVGKPPATDRLTDTLLKHLDANKDGRVDEPEGRAAADRLRALDANDDELIGPGELAGRTAYPGALGSILLTPPAPGTPSDPTADALPLVVLPLRTADTRWADVVAARCKEAKRPAPDADVLLGLRRSAPAAAWQVRFGAGKEVGGTLEAVGGKPPADARLVLTAGSTRLALRADQGKLAGQAATARRRYAALLAECDADADGGLDAAELAARKAGLFRPLLPAADRDGDGKLGGQELAAWLDLQGQVARGHVLLTVLDHGAGLFELLDADHDGSLSARELRTAWDRLTAAGCVSGGRFDRTGLPRHLLATVSRGHPRAALGKPVRPGPAWSRAMDRNGDGDVSIKEWVGDPGLFGRWDADGDGLLSAGEAEKASLRK